jgi:RNA polymerase nonessential primary-like sigma factor
MFGLNGRVGSADAPVGQDSDKSLLDTIPDTDTADPEAWLQSTNLVGRLDEWLSSLPDKHSEVLARRFGLRGYEMSTLEDVGREIGLTRERVRQIQVDALRRLREIVENNGLSGQDLLE